ncbi:ABC-type transport system involved in multi-copper enzyme maturation permease subunit [Catenuloplanes nepalensis]|uniref:ABC-type transport system involved in multi-copper enzyme maturation permease subunit n=1 Tax=Catenuloplanes nepalensis TaxID=587533 RepID=A0ABT9MU59_9ACTN|nr:ABC transporter permease [Catenuloplanes nepalensis]MDP9794977.1 ABC-type transport system involved in multi-copper enzyme maturation permease subunit [Catenuloplanes nepalensis]
MTTLTASHRLTFRGVVAGEWTKFWSLRSSWITLGVSLLLIGALGAIAAFAWSPDAGGEVGPPGPLGPDGADAVSIAISGTTFASLALGVLGVLVGAGEYTTGLIRATLTAVPSRLPVLWAKALVYGPIALIAGVAGAFGAFAVGAPVLDGESVSMVLSDDNVLRSLFGAGLYLGLVGVLGVALGILVRSSAGGIAILAGGLLILPGLAMLLPSGWYDAIDGYLPSTAGAQIMSTTSDRPWTGLAIFAGWVAVTLAAAAYRLVKTDA